MRCMSKSTVLNHLRNRVIDGKEHKIRNLVFFCHGTPGTIAWNYPERPDIDLEPDDLIGLPSNIFSLGGRIFSYACQTARQGFGQSLADHFDVSVRAFYRRSFYELCLRDPSDSDRIATILREHRETQEGQKIDIPPDHEAFPHPGLGTNIPFTRGRAEGTRNYALWRKGGAIGLPITGNTPAEQPWGFIELQSQEE